MGGMEQDWPLSARAAQLNTASGSQVEASELATMSN